MLLNVDLDHHTTFGSRAEVEATVRGVARARAAGRARRDARRRSTLELAVPGEHNRRNAAAALAALELAGVARAGRGARDRRVPGRGPAARAAAGRPAACACSTATRHHPAEVAADLDAARAETDGRLLVLFQPHLYSRTLHLAHEFGVALAGADAVCVTEIYPAREEPLPGVSGRLIVGELAQVRPGMRVGWAPSVEDGVRDRGRLGAARRHRADARRRRRRPRGAAPAGGARRDDRGGRRARAVHDARHRRTGARRSRGRSRSARWRSCCAGRRSGRSRWPPSVSARTSSSRTTESTRSCSGSPASWRRSPSRVTSCAPAAARRTRSASTAPAPPGWAPSSSRARSRARSAAACG